MTPRAKIATCLGLGGAWLASWGTVAIMARDLLARFG